MVDIVAVKTKQQKRAFIDFPHELYRDDPNYVPELYLSQKELLDERKNPFFQHSKADLFLAMRHGQVVGRIAAIRNNNYNTYAGDEVGFFGFFDLIDDYEVAEALLDRVKSWIKGEGLSAIYGPANFTTNDTAGVLVDGFDRPPVVMMAYNKPYYPRFLEKYGFVSKMNLLAYLMTEDSVSRRTLELSGKLEDRLRAKGVSIRQVNLKKFDQEVDHILHIYKEAWKDNWGFVPPTEAEFRHLATGLKMIINPEYAFIAESEGEAVAFSLAIPDINVIQRTISRGRLFPFGIFKLLLGKNKIKRSRIITLGVLESHRRMGVEGVFYAKTIQAGLKNGVTEAEASWILETSEMINKGLLSLNADPYKRYRIYELSLA